MASGKEKLGRKGGDEFQKYLFYSGSGILGRGGEYFANAGERGENDRQIPVKEGRKKRGGRVRGAPFSEAKGAECSRK